MTALPEVTEIIRWRYQPGDRLILRTEQQITAQDAAMIRDRVRAALALPDDAPIGIFGGGWTISVVEQAEQ